MPTTILLARHGESDWNVERRVQGHADRPLTPTGLAQARELVEALADEPLDAVYSSDLSRAYETARIVAQPRGLTVIALPELRERHFGTWEGLTDDEVLQRFPHAGTGADWGDAETSEQLAERVQEALREIAARHEDGRVLVVTHGGPLRALLRWCAGEWDGTIANCQLHRIAVERGIPRGID
jgi:broad specificity phosphatase PhoE